jgi:hypothetical protein
MPEKKVKTIEIDQVLPGDHGEDTKRAHSHKYQAEPDTKPFPDLRSTLGWKTQITLLLTQGFLYLRSKSWGKWIIGPLVVLLILLAIPLAIIGIFTLIIISLIRKI